MDDFGLYDPTGDTQLVQQALARAAALRKNAVAPQGQMISGRYVAPSTSQMLLPIADNLAADAQEARANQKQIDINTQTQQALNTWLGQQPQTQTVYGAGDQGPTMTKVEPSDTDMTQWAARGANLGPLGKALAAKSLEDTIVNAPIREEKKQAKLENTQLLNDRFTADREERIARTTQTLLQRQNELAARMADRALDRSSRESYQREMLQNQRWLQELRGKQKMEQLSATGEDAVGLSPEALDNAAMGWLTDRTLPALGMGKQGSAMRQAIMNRAAELSAMSPEELAQHQIQSKSTSQALGQLSKQEAQVGAFERNFQKNLALAKPALEKLDNTGVPILQKWINAGKRSVAGDEDTAVADVAVKSVVNEYSKIISGSMGNTALAEGEIKKVESMLNSAQSPEQVKAVIDFMERETKNRMAGFAEQKSEMRRSLLPKTRGREQANVAAPVEVGGLGPDQWVGSPEQIMDDINSSKTGSAAEKAAARASYARWASNRKPPAQAPAPAPATPPKTVSWGDLAK